ncbi:hypothetical protein MSG28_001055 [Choristoneura fumiferana]|uniref:Uncharacterized protein n=1 Tax=Choristoneura fumiferana TaxID=7141 RepID=A0ACC0K3D0_CHOFU|nr:hypothetical protein MSG28_001055 [Choristoneura fumiferana]
MPRLERLYLHNNRLERIPPDSFTGMPKLHKLRLDSNALICDCNMLWLVRMLTVHSDMTVAATCYGPANAIGTPLSAIKEQDLNCKYPEIMQGPEDLLIEFGKDAVFSCTVTGDPEPEIVWFRDSVAIPLDSTRYEVMNNGSLMVHNADETDVVRPDFIIVPRDTAVAEGEKVNFECTARGQPVGWNKDVKYNGFVLPSARAISTAVITTTEISEDVQISHMAMQWGRKPLLPTTGINAMDCRRNLDESTRACFVAGDIRANEQIGLAAMHTIWMREHNRLALQLKSLNSFWDGEKVYQEARKIVGAQIQMITYYHWLPLILGREHFKKLGEYKEYDSYLNPSVSNVFATAALRFGHSMINPVLHRYDENFDPIPQGHLLLRHAFFSPWRLVDEGGVDPLLRGMFTTPAKLKTSTQNLNSELTEKLFYTAHAVALDLAAINIQRGRDHAIPGYTKWREVCNMSEVNDFDDLSNEISDQTVRDKLKHLYGSVHNIDVWVGGILEDQVDGGKVGPLFSCLLLEQFKRLRDGDRLWFENPTVFKPEQLAQIKKTSLARILCDNGDNIDTIGENVFLIPEVQDGMVSCDDLSSIDIRFWADCESCGDYTQDSTLSRTRRDTTSTKYHDSQNYRLNDLETANEDLQEMVRNLQKRLELLEETCNRQ